MTKEEENAVSLLSDYSIVNKVLALHLLIGLGWSASAIVSKITHVERQTFSKRLYFGVNHYCMIHHSTRSNGWSSMWYTIKMIEYKNGVFSEEIIGYDNFHISRSVKNFYLTKKLREYVQKR